MPLRILDVSPKVVFPPVDGAGVRIYNLLSHLSHNHDVRQFSQVRATQLWRTPKYAQVRAGYSEYRYKNLAAALAAEWCARTWINTAIHSGMGLRVFRPRFLLDSLRWADVVLVEAPWQFAFCYRHASNAKVVLATHNLEFVKSASHAEAAGLIPERSIWHRYTVAMERFAVSRADLILAVSEEDRRGFMLQYDVPACRSVVIPNGADTERFCPVSAERRSLLRRKLELPDRPTVVYLAANAKPPHRAGLAWVRRLAERMPGCTFLIVGGIFGAPERQNNVIATGRIEDPASYLQAADISLCPIEFGGGTKIKMIESMAVGLPTVVFEETRFGTNARHGEHVWVVEKDEEHIYSGLSLLLQDKALYLKLSREGRRYVVRNHEWRDSSARLEESLIDLVDCRRDSFGMVDTT